MNCTIPPLGVFLFGVLHIFLARMVCARAPVIAVAVVVVATATAAAAAAFHRSRIFCSKLFL